MNQAKILDVKINRITAVEVLEKIKSFLLSDKQYYIVTLNPEMVVEAQKNNYFKDIINEADLVIPDGIGILWGLNFLKFFAPTDKGGRGVRRTLDNSLAFIFALYKFISSLLKLLFYPKHRKNVLKHRIHGIDLIYKICEADFSKEKKIYLLGAREGIAEEVAKVLSEKYKYLNIVGAEEGIPVEIFNFQFSIFNKFSISNFKRNLKSNPPQNNKFFVILNLFQNLFVKIHLLSRRSQNKFGMKDCIYENDNNELIQRINKAQPDILFVAFGAPKQEKWIYENLKKMPSVKLAIGVGGSFDFISGKIKRAPLIFQKLGLEWLWRLILEPRRIKRIYNATIKFGWMVLKRSYKHINI